MKVFYYTLLVLVILIASCDSNHTSPVITITNTKVKDSMNSEVIKDSAESINYEIVQHTCVVYKEDDFRTELTCLYFEKDFSYDEYIKQANSASDCDKFYSDLKNKNDSICEKYKCSEEELKEHCIDLFYYEEDTINKKDKCVEQKCSRNKFISQCDDYEDLCTYGVILGCLNKSGLAPTDFNISSCAINNKNIIQRECTVEACIKDEVNACADDKCKLKPTKEYIKKCKKEEEDKCTTQNRVRLF